jgi:hypothetical protein
MNGYITRKWILRDTIIGWKNNIALVNQFYRGYDKAWRDKPDGAQIGATVQVRVPQRFVVNEGQALQVQPILQQTVPISLNHQFQVAMEWSTFDQTVIIEDVQENYSQPAGRALANKCDVQAGAEVYKTVYNTAGTPGTAITDTKTYTAAVAKLRNIGCPEELVAVLDPNSQSDLMSATAALFNPQTKIAKYFNNGIFSGPALGIDEWAWDPNMPNFTTGTFTTATPITTAGGQTGSTLTVSGMGTYALVAGDTFTVVGVNSVNPVSYVDTGQLQEFTLSIPVAGTTTGTLTFSPPIITSGPLQTVTASPANGAALLFKGATGITAATMAATSTRQSLVFNPKAFAFVMADLASDLPGADATRYHDEDARVSMRRVVQYQIQSDQLPRRVECLVGIASVQPQFAIRMMS